MKAKLITVLFLIYLVNIQPMLQSMDASGAVDAISQTLHVKRVSEVIARKMPHITSLRVSDLYPNPEMLAELIKNYPNLKKLNLYNCLRSADGLETALEALPSERRLLPLLEELNLSGTNAIPYQVYIIASHWPNLKILNLNDCQRSADGLARALADLPAEQR